jgi:hypothetical protein
MRRTLTAMRSETRRALAVMSRHLGRAAISFRLGGSGLLYALGLVERVGDLDLVFESRSRRALGAVLADLTGTEPDFGAGQEPGFVSAWRCTHQLSDQSLDLTGGVAVRLGSGRVVDLPYAAGATWALGATTIPLAPPEQWWLIYRVHGADERAALAGRAARPGAIESLLAELDVARSEIP